MIIDYTYFMQPMAYIAGLEKRSGDKPTDYALSLRNNINAYVEIYEPRYLIDLLGDNYVTIIDVNCDAILPLLRNQETRQSVIASFVWFHYMRVEASRNTIAGEKTKQSDNSFSTSPRLRLIDSWNTNVVDASFAIISELEKNGIEINPKKEAEIFAYISPIGL